MIPGLQREPYRRNSRIMRSALVLSCLLLAAAVEAKDLVVKQRSSSGFGGGVPSDETVYITTGKIVTDKTLVSVIKQ